MNLRQRQVEIVCDNHYTVKILTRASVSELENVLNDFRKSEIFQDDEWDIYHLFDMFDKREIEFVHLLDVADDTLFLEKGIDKPLKLN
tara:strand:+ start:2915 stop:3178 length:264 start_codon:yes stop_codon:yes gene_type:complete